MRGYIEKKRIWASFLKVAIMDEITKLRKFLSSMDPERQMQFAWFRTELQDLENQKESVFRVCMSIINLYKDI